MANLFSKDEIFNYVYKESPSTDNSEGILPKPSVSVPQGELHLPEMWECVKSLEQVVPVDYVVPGCPPAQVTTNELLDIMLSGRLPQKGECIGASKKNLCDECPRERKELKLKAFKRHHLHPIDGEKCLLDQGFLCCGPATRGGCGALCPSANMPCIGCYGSDDIEDQGAKMLGVLASLLDYQTEEEINKALKEIIDPAGYFYKFSMTGSLLFKKRADISQKEAVSQ